MIKYLWAGSLSAIDSIGTIHKSGWAIAETKEAAQIKFLTEALKLWPPERGWENHTALVTFIPFAPTQPIEEPKP